MGLNLVIGCHVCQERLWLYRGEIQSLEDFYRAHWPDDAGIRHRIELSDDQALGEWLTSYVENPGKYGRRL